MWEKWRATFIFPTMTHFYGLDWQTPERYKLVNTKTFVIQVKTTTHEVHFGNSQSLSLKIQFPLFPVFVF